jgi:hypothetical protein
VLYTVIFFFFFFFFKARPEGCVLWSGGSG